MGGDEKETITPSLEQERSHSITAHPGNDRDGAEAYYDITEMKNDRLEALRMLAASGQQGPKSAAIVELCDALQACQRRRDKAIGPTLPEVMAYAERIGMNGGDPEAFFDHHNARGWMLGPRGTVPMRDFQSAMRTWHRNGKARAPVVGTKPAYGVG